MPVHAHLSVFLFLSTPSLPVSRWSIWASVFVSVHIYLTLNHPCRDSFFMLFVIFEADICISLEAIKRSSPSLLGRALKVVWDFLRQSTCNLMQPAAAMVLKADAAVCVEGDDMAEWIRRWNQQDLLIYHGRHPCSQPWVIWSLLPPT